MIASLVGMFNLDLRLSGAWPIAASPTDSFSGRPGLRTGLANRESYRASEWTVSYENYSEH